MLETPAKAAAFVRYIEVLHNRVNSAFNPTADVGTFVEDAVPQWINQFGVGTDIYQCLAEGRGINLLWIVLTGKKDGILFTLIYKLIMEKNEAAYLENIQDNIDYIQ